MFAPVMDLQEVTPHATGQDRDSQSDSDHLRAIIATQAEIAREELDIDRVMQLVTERSQELTDATGAVIEIAEGEEIVYRVATGTAAPSVGARLRIDSSLSGYCVRTSEILRCDDVETDPRVDLAACRRIGVGSMVVVPLIHERQTIGVLKVLAPDAHHFRDRDVQTLQLMAEFIAIAMGRANAFAERQALLAERSVALEALQESEARFRSSFDSAAIGIALVALNGQFMQVNQALCTLTGYNESELVQLTFQDITHPDDLATDLAYVERLLAGEISSYQMEKRYIHRDGHLVWILLTGALVRDGDGNPRCFVAQIQDITERKSLEDRLTFHAFHDPLTGLPNRALFLDRLETALRRARRSQQFIGVLFIDLDNFKFVNDSLGHASGDQLLIDVARRLQECVRECDTVARLGGDEFTVLLESLASVEDAEIVAERIGGMVRQRFEIAGQELFVTTSIGVVTTRGGELDLTDMLRSADIAMYHAKQTGKDRHEHFNPSLGGQAIERLRVENDLRRAIERNELRLHYQPIVRIADGTMTGVEALLRWDHPIHGSIPPAKFIPIAEETGLITTIGRWVLNDACRQLSLWHAQHPDAAPLNLSVNLSARQVEHPDLVEEVANALNVSGLDPDRLILEVTESVVMANVERAMERLRALKSLGVRIAIDDFGTGYSSLAYLQRLPVDRIKIDRSFIAGIEHSAEDRVIVGTMLNLGRSLGRQMLAEGVETAAQATQLGYLGCELAQGYYFARPQPFEALNFQREPRRHPRFDPGSLDFE